MGTNVGEHQQEANQYSCCKVCKNCPAFRKIADVKDGLQIYHHRTSKEEVNKNTEAFELDARFTDAFVLHNTKDVEISLADVNSELDQNKVTCPRCRKILKHAHKLILKIPIIAKQDILGICDYCRMKDRTKLPCRECENILKKYTLSIDKVKSETKNEGKIWVSRIERLLKDEKDIKIERRRVKSDVNVDSVHRNVVVCERPSVLSSDMMLVRKQQEKLYTIDNAMAYSDPTERQHLRKKATLSDNNFLARGNEERTVLDSVYIGTDKSGRSSILRDHDKIVKDYTFQKTQKLEHPVIDIKELHSSRNFISLSPHRLRSPRLGETTEIVKSSEESILTKSHTETNYKQINIPSYKILRDYFGHKKDDVTKVYSKYKPGLLKFRHVTSKSTSSLIQSRTEYKLMSKRNKQFSESIASVEKYNSEVSLHSVDTGTLQTPVKLDFDYFFPKEIKVEIINPKSRVSSSKLIEVTREMLHIRAEEEKRQQEETRKRKLEEKERRQIIREEKKRLIEEKKRLDEEEKQRVEQERKIIEEQERKRQEEETIKKSQLTKKVEKKEIKEKISHVASKHKKEGVSNKKNKSEHELKHSKVDQQNLKQDKEAEMERKQKEKKEREERLQREKEEKQKVKEEKEKLKKEREERLRQEREEKQKAREAKQKEREAKQREREAKQQQEKETKQQEMAAKQLGKEAKPHEKEIQEQKKPQEKETKQQEIVPIQPERESKQRENVEDTIKKEESKQEKESDIKDSNLIKSQSNPPPVQPTIIKETEKLEKEAEIDIKKLRDPIDKKPKEISPEPKPERAVPNIKTKKEPEKPPTIENKNTKKEPEKPITKEIDMKKIKIRKASPDDLILQLVKMKKLEQPRKRAGQRRLSAKDISPLLIKAHENHTFRTSNCIICLDSDLELEIESIAMEKHKDEMIDVIVGEKILKYKLPIVKAKEDELMPALYKSEFNVEPVVVETKEIVEVISEDKERISPLLMSTKLTKMAEQEPAKGVIRYALSDRSFIDKGWTMLPTEKVVRKMNVYRMRPAHPEFDWFAHNKNKRLMQYDSGEKLAEFDDDGRGRWYYRNGRLALDYYDAEETNAQQRFVVYSSGEPDERGRSHPITILATFDYLGNGIVFDHAGKIRLKYNQTEGVVLDRGIGPVSHWKWHTLNDPPVLQQVMIDTQMTHKDPDIIKLGGLHDDKTRPDNDEMLAIEFDNFIKEKSRKLSQKFKPFQIKMKALKINEHFSLRVLDQATIYLIFRDGSTNLKLNIGMILDHQEIVDTDTAEVGEVSNNLERFPARTDSLAGLQRSVAYAQRVERARVERERRLKPPEPCASADQLISAASRPLRPPLRIASSTSTTTTQQCRCKYRKPPSNNLYYDTRFI